ncbi:MAG: hypothetical protein ACE5EM_00535 [Sphingomonadales bacterium]
MHKVVTPTLLGLLTIGLAAPAALAQHPNPEPRPGFSTQTTVTNPDGSKTTTVISPESLRAVGDNELPYVESNIFDKNGNEMVNTLPSTPTVDWNLHDGPVIETAISEQSPADDLSDVLNGVLTAAQGGTVDQALIQFGLDVLEGNPIARTYSGMPMLHYNGPEKVRKVTPIFDGLGNKIGGNVDVHQVWWDGRIESDVAFIDPTDVQDVEWTITYTIDVLKGGQDDFSPWTMYFDDLPDPVGAPNAFVDSGTHGPPHIAFDATFFPMKQGQQSIFKIKHAPGKYFNLVYSWGWRIHPPRVQVMENSLKMAGPGCGGGTAPCKRLPQWEIDVFGADPRANKAAAIAQIGELAPAKRMWQALIDAQTATAAEVVTLMNDALLSFTDWQDRRNLPRDVVGDPTADVNLVFLNNTIYGDAKDFLGWTGRGSVFKTTVQNGDHFLHGYVNVDFGGSRGWEPQFQFTGGPTQSHTFGRAHWWVTAGGPNGPIGVPPIAADGTLGRHDVEITLNFDAPEALALYQFDPLHHDVAVYSLH